MVSVKFLKGISLNGVWYSKDKEDSFSRLDADRLEKKGIVAIIRVPSEKKEKAAEKTNNEKGGK